MSIAMAGKSHEKTEKSRLPIPPGRREQAWTALSGPLPTENRFALPARML
jgi:hypothetical protein